MVNVFVSVYGYVVFFKQKTAYEMRISDWSSDVCSSDLGDLDRAIEAAIGGFDPQGIERGALVGPLEVIDQGLDLHRGQTVGQIAGRQRRRANSAHQLAVAIDLRDLVDVGALGPGGGVDQTDV